MEREIIMVADESKPDTTSEAFSTHRTVCSRAGRKPRPRIPRAGEWFVFHDDPRYVYKIEGVTAGVVKFTWTNLQGDSQEYTRSLRKFNEFFTRVPL